MLKACRNLARKVSTAKSANLAVLLGQFWPKLGAPIAPCLNFNFYAAPKSDVALNILGCVFWFWIVPGRIFVNLPVHNNVIVAGSTFPRADGMSTALLKICLIDRIWRKILISFYNLAVIAFCQNRTVPSRSNHRDHLHNDKKSLTDEFPHGNTLLLEDSPNSVYSKIQSRIDSE